MNIGIVTWITYKNYGSFLQAFALQEFLKTNQLPNIILSDAQILFPKMSQKAQKQNVRQDDQAVPMICHISPVYLLKAFRRKYRNWKHRKLVQPYALSQKEYDRFRRENLSIFENVTYDTLRSLNEIFDCFLCGSDQIWNVFDQNFNGYYYLDFVSRPKIAYAPSVGTTQISAEKAATIRAWLTDYSALSVREQETALQLQKLTGRSVEWVVDPCLLHDREWWAGFANGADLSDKRPYVLCYFLENKDWYHAYARALAGSRALRLVLIPSRIEFTKRRECYRGAVGPREFVALISRAAYVITDSYHGSIFSILFEKQFIYLKRFQDNDPICQNIRVNSLFSCLGLMNRILEEKEFDDSDDPLIEFGRVKRLLQQQRDRSQEYLLNAIKDVYEDHKQ